MLLTNPRIFLLAFLPTIKSIWPPSYKVNLSHQETFVISEIFSSDDDYIEEDEMIKKANLKSYKTDNEDKYERLHKLVDRRNAEESRPNRHAQLPYYNKKKIKKEIETNFDKDEAVPWESGFVDKSGNIKSDSKTVFDFNGNTLKVNQTWQHKSRRDTKNDTDYMNYDYNALKAEYYKNIKDAQVNKDTLNYTETKDEESVKDAFDAIIGNANKKPNCTIEEQSGIGMAAAKCIMSDLTRPDLNAKERSTIFHRIATIILIWIMVYLLVAIPCWCQRGWCCCCFQCKFCKPRERIDVAKKYLLDNPLGVYHTPDNEIIMYEPTNFEKYAQKNLEKALSNL